MSDDNQPVVEQTVQKDGAVFTQVNPALDKRDLIDLKDDLRREMDTRFSSLKAWGIAGLVGGQTLAAIAASYIGPSRVAGETLDVLTRIF